MVFPVLDEVQKLAYRFEIPGSRQMGQGDEITGILRPSDVVPGQQLERDQLRQAGDRHGEAGQHLERLGRGHHFGLDA